MRQDRKARQRRPRAARGGYVLYAVLIILALLAIGIGLTLRDTAYAFQEGAVARASTEIKGALESGLNLAVARIQSEDPAEILNPANNWDIFADPPPTVDFVPPSTYPPSGPLAGAFRVRVGLTLGQQAQGTTGEAADTTYGQLVQVQIMVEAIGSGLPPSEERLVVGVLVPRERSHAN